LHAIVVIYILLLLYIKLLYIIASEK